MMGSDITACEGCPNARTMLIHTTNVIDLNSRGTMIATTIEVARVCPAKIMISQLMNDIGMSSAVAFEFGDMHDSTDFGMFGGADPFVSDFYETDQMAGEPFGGHASVGPFSIDLAMILSMLTASGALGGHPFDVNDAAGNTGFEFDLTGGMVGVNVYGHQPDVMPAWPINGPSRDSIGVPTGASLAQVLTKMQGAL